MARQRRGGGLELNFDGLTDSVTNLVGALILLVVLLIGITKEVTGRAAPPPPVRQQASQSLSGKKTADELLLQLEQLRIQVSSADQEITSGQQRVEELSAKVESLLDQPKDLVRNPISNQEFAMSQQHPSERYRRVIVMMSLVACCAAALPRRAMAQDWRESAAGRALLERLQATEANLNTLDNRMDTIEQRARGLYERLAALQPPPETEPEKPPQDRGVKVVKFRPPLTYRSEKKKSLAIVCQENRLLLIDFEAVGKAKSAILTPFILGTKRDGEGTVDVPGGDFQIIYELHTQGSTVSGTLGLLPKPGRGETWAQFNAANSSVRAALESADSSTTLVQVPFYPDSFDIFRQIREKAWDRKLEVGWIPFTPGQPIGVGGGSLSGG